MDPGGLVRSGQTLAAKIIESGTREEAELCQDAGIWLAAS
jgi:hypothetical protein